jgi:hypothetical protein
MKNYIFPALIFLLGIGLLCYPPFKANSKEIAPIPVNNKDSIIIEKKSSIESHLDSSKASIQTAKKFVKHTQKNLSYIKDKYFIYCPTTQPNKK